MLGHLISLPHYFISFIVLISLLVFVHEFGHFIVARWCGVRVDVFSIGFGPELFGWNDRHGTRWKFSALPLGGYVKMFGDSNVMSLPDGTEREMTAAEQRVSFHHKPLARRAAVVAAGPAANYIFAVVVLAVMFATYGQQYSSTEIGQVQPGSAAESAGLKAGDKVVAINGTAMRRFEDIAGTVQLGLDEPLTISVERDGKVLDVKAQPRIIEERDIFGHLNRMGRLGITSNGAGVVVQHGVFGAIGAAANETWRVTAGTLQAVWQMVIGIRPADELGGVLRMGQMSGEVTKLGVAATVSLAALFSINLGLINLFPVPMLDGGHLLFYAIEAIRGRPLGRRAQEWGFRVGLALVVALFVFATRNDLMAFFWRASSSG
ncbi:MAG: RIP metalloprotease RseP [Dongiaceae bacterium]